MWTPIVIFLSVQLLVVGQDPACPGQTNIVEMCRDNSMTGEIVFLDSSTSENLSGSCTCHIKAETDPVDITVNVTSAPTGCLAAIDFPSLSLSAFCDQTLPDPVSVIVQPGTDVFASLIRKHMNETTLFCVEIRHTNIDTGGQMKVVCTLQSLNDVLNKSMVFPSSSSVAAPAATEQQQPSTITPAAPVTSVPPATSAPPATFVPPATGAVQPTPTSDAASSSKVIRPSSVAPGASSNVAETQANTVQVVDTAQPGESSQPLMPSTTQGIKQSAGNSDVNTPVLETSKPPDPTAQLPETAVVVPSNEPAATTDLVEATAVTKSMSAIEESIIPTTQATSSQTPQTGANTGQPSDAVFVSSLVVGILGGIFLILVILGIFVHFRDKRHARATSLIAKKSRIREEYENRALVED